MIVQPGETSPRGLTGWFGMVGVISVIGTIGGVTSILSDSGAVAGGGGMATVAAAGDWGAVVRSPAGPIR